MGPDHITEIAHEAIVKSIDSHSVTVLLSGKESCSGCQAQKACGLSDSKTNEIIIRGRHNVFPGSRVTVLMKQSSGYLALFLGYLLPLIIFLVSMIILSSFSVAEPASGLIALGILVPYYLILSLFRKQLNQKFSLTLKS